ncbi:DUF262 domain-containing protein [Croceibacterium mercuriale]|nr:DUF262 domain-containing protein [Croceibacterium mercuriale]
MSMIVREIEPRSLRDWWFEERSIDFAPVYQRKGSIWGVATQQRLIDTVLNGFDIPKVYLADFTRSERTLDMKGLPYAVIDGKQRLQALFAFFSGRLTLSRQFVLFDQPARNLGGLDYSKLVRDHPDIAERFANFRLTVMGVVTSDEKNINELFLRLNTSSPLTGAEKRNAMLGTVPDLIRRLVEHSFFREKVRFTTLRGQDANAAAKLLLLEHAGGAFDTKKTQLDRLVADPARMRATAKSRAEEVDLAIGGFVEAIEDTENVDISHSADRVEQALDRLAPLFRSKDPLLAAQAQIPIIYLLAGQLDHKELLSLRAFLRRFQRLREINRRLSPEDPARDPELTQFELMNRSSNDQASIDGRYRIILHRFKAEFYLNPILG